MERTAHTVAAVARAPCRKPSYKGDQQLRRTVQKYAEHDARSLAESKDTRNHQLLARKPPGPNPRAGETGSQQCQPSTLKRDQPPRPEAPQATHGKSTRRCSRPRIGKQDQPPGPATWQATQASPGRFAPRMRRTNDFSRITVGSIQQTSRGKATRRPVRLPAPVASKHTVVTTRRACATASRRGLLQLRMTHVIRHVPKQKDVSIADSLTHP
jgi:hypothetical protein